MKLELCLATRDERRRPLPGDELIPDVMGSVTHAITIRAKPEDVWPWLVQLGSGRAGWYSYNRIDNGGEPSVRQIIPKLQQVAVGDIMPAIPGTKDAFIVREVLRRKALVLVVPIQTALQDADPHTRMMGPLRVSWALVVESVDDTITRLITRGRFSRDWLAAPAAASSPPSRPIFIERVYGLLAKLPWPLLLPIATASHYLMESRMLRGIKMRAERLSSETAQPPPELLHQ